MQQPVRLHTLCSASVWLFAPPWTALDAAACLHAGLQRVAKLVAGETLLLHQQQQFTVLM